MKNKTYKKVMGKAATFLPVYLLAFLLLTVACVDDDGNYDYQKLPTFEVDTVGQRTSYSVQQFSNLQIPSNLNYDGDKSKLQYTWSVYLTDQGQRDVTVDTLSHSENLDEEIREAPGNYLVEFCALDPETGVRAMMTYSLTVESVVGQGLLVFYTNNGSADIDIVKTPLFDASVADDRIVRSSFSTGNPDYQLKGTPINVRWQNGRFILLVTDQDAVQLSEDDMTMLNDFNSMFYEKPETCKPQGAFLGNIQAVFNDGKIHTTISSWAVGTPLFGSRRMGDYENAAPFGVNSMGGGMFGYDQTGKYFLTGGMWTSTMDKVDVKGDAFDFGNVGKTMVYMADGYGSVSNTASYAQGAYLAYCIMQDTVDATHRYLYVADVSQSSFSRYKAQAAIDLADCPAMANAKYFAFGRRGPVVFYADDHAVYQLHYSISTNTATGADQVWQTSERITMLKMFNNSITVNDLNLQSKYLMVATYNDTTGQGTLHILETDIASGVLNTTPVKTFTGFGEIKDVDFKSN